MQEAKLQPKIQNFILKKTLTVLTAGGLVIAPTDTVYGALVDASNQDAVEKLISFKERPRGKPISIFVDSLEMLQQYVEVDENQLKTLKSILPGPFTAVLKSKGRVSWLLESETGTLGVRYIKHDFITALVKQFGRPVTATSANLAGQGSRYDVESLLASLSDKKREIIDMVVNGGKLSQNKPSTVVDLTRPEIKVIRQGDLSVGGERSFTSHSPEETKKIAKKILQDALRVSPSSLRKPLVFILQGDLGVGKTIFTKAIGEELRIKNIISPTFVIYYEYDVPRSTFHATPTKFVHIDLYNLEKDEEFEHLGIEKYLKPGNILCIEWGEKAGKIYETLKKTGEVVFIKMIYTSRSRREILVNKN